MGPRLCNSKDSSTQISVVGNDSSSGFFRSPTYPEHLSRGLVLIKSWLIAIPHLLILGVFTATWTFGETSDGARSVLGGGRLGILVAIVAIILLFTGRYPTGLHDLIMGVNRWIYRVIVYVALMTDEYPPFRLDQGGREASALESSFSK